MEMADKSFGKTQTELLPCPRLGVGVEVGIPEAGVRMALHPALVCSIEDALRDFGGDSNLVHFLGIAVGCVVVCHGVRGVVSGSDKEVVK